MSFDEAASAFSDSLSLTIPDPGNSEGEYRYILLGTSAMGRLIVVSHTEAVEQDTHYRSEASRASGATRL